MKIGFLLPSVYTAEALGKGRIFAPQGIGVSLADGLIDNGHQVYFYTSQDVNTKATVIPGDSTLTDKKLSYFQYRNRDQAEQDYTVMEILKRDFEFDLTMRAYKDAKDGKLDIIHSYHDFAAHYFSELTGFKTLYTLHDPIPQEEDTIEYHRLSKFLHHNYISISNSQRKGILDLNFIETVYHGIDLEDYKFHPDPKGNLIHFGRIMEDKGTDIAIEVAKKVGLPLHIATSTTRANRSEDFFNQKIAPQIDEKNVFLHGYMVGKEKSEYIGNGKAFILPLQWEEPFGLVMIEAMACGTPVIAYNHGSVAEIVEDGVTGFIVNETDAQGSNKEDYVIKKYGIEGLLEAVQRIGEIDRNNCRKRVEELFSKDVMVGNYEKVYQKVLAQK